jgi:hypothetical protein
LFFMAEDVLVDTLFFMPDDVIVDTYCQIGWIVRIQ